MYEAHYAHLQKREFRAAAIRAPILIQNTNHAPAGAGRTVTPMARGGFPNMMGGGNMQQLARQAQKLQQQRTKMQE